MISIPISLTRAKGNGCAVAGDLTLDRRLRLVVYLAGVSSKIKMEDLYRGFVGAKERRASYYEKTVLLDL